MDHGENDKRFYVYIHKDKDGNIRYIGSGSGYRYSNIGCRTKEHIDMWDSLDKIVLKDGLSKTESLEIEASLIDEHWHSGLLFNRVKFVHKVKPIEYGEVNEYLYYDESSPTCLRWKKHSRKRRLHQPAGTGNGSGYYNVDLNGTKYRAHRLVWVLVNKEDLVTNMLIDHIDGNKSNNKISNLRLVTPTENNLNRDFVKNAKRDYVTISSEKGGTVFIFIHSKFDDELGKIVRRQKRFVPSKFYPDIELEDAISKTRDYLLDLKQKFISGEVDINFKSVLKEYENNDIVFRFLSGVSAKDLAKEYEVSTSSIWHVVNRYKDRLLT